MFKQEREMKKSLEVKERIIEAATSLIAESEGDVSEISTRAIAEKAGVGVGLINYHFQAKDSLIEICVERMIGDVIAAFASDTKKLSQVESLKHSAKMVMDFLIENPAVARISILADCKTPKTEDNTMKSVMSANAKIGNLGLSDKEKFILSFALTAAMQALFLRKDQSGDVFGYDINIKEQRDTVLDLLIDSLFGGYINEQGSSSGKVRKKSPV
jgi:AcrR family transcriptional regulator